MTGTVTVSATVPVPAPVAELGTRTLTGTDRDTDPDTVAATAPGSDGLRAVRPSWCSLQSGGFPAGRRRERAFGRSATLDGGWPGSWEGGMNTTRNTSPATISHGRLLAHHLALEAAALAISLVMKLPPQLRSLQDQVVRSASSVPANLAEGAGRTGRDRLHHWRIASGSALEVDSHLRLLRLVGAVETARAQEALQLLDRVRALTWRLIHPAP